MEYSESGVVVEWSVAGGGLLWCGEVVCFDPVFSMMNAGAWLLLLKSERSLLDCLRPYLLASFETKSSVFWRIRMRRLQLSSSTVAWTAGRCTVSNNCPGYISVTVYSFCVVF
jgi:hypothetical protein